MKYDSQVTLLTDEQFKTAALPSFLKVFNSPCSFVAPFTTLMTSRILVYCEVYPDRDLIDPIIEAASREGDNGFYFSFVEDYHDEIWYPGLSGDSIYLKTWFIPFEKIRFYQEQTFLTSHVMYSPQGKWGAYVSSEDFMILGGIPEVVNRIKQQIPSVDALVNKFMEDQKWRYFSLGGTMEWIPKLLDHVYCPEETKRILEEYGMNNSGK